MYDKNKLYFSVSINILLILLLLSACMSDKESPLAINTTTLPASEYHSNAEVFIPSLLACPRNLRIALGPTWRNITVGQSSRYDLEALYGVQASKDRSSELGDFADTFSINLTASASRDRRLSQSASICTVDGTIVALALDPVHDGNLSSLLQDWVALLGEPDIVNWAPSIIGWQYRILVWPEQGVAIEVDAGAILHDINAGFVQTVVFFPFMQPIDWNQWPLSWLVQDAPNTTNSGYPTQENPFDFDAMIMTVVAPPPNQDLVITTEPIFNSTPTPNIQFNEHE